MADNDDYIDPARERDNVRKTMSTAEYRKKHWRIDHVRFYPKQVELLNLGASIRERLAKAANQCGKTYVGCAEATYHATGRYPPWWEGWRCDHACEIVVSSATSQLLRDVAQKHLFGKPGELGRGLVPYDLIGKVTILSNPRDCFDTALVKHVSGDWSTIHFKSYAQGRESFQGMSVDFALCDEEPPADCYGEILTRISATNGRVLTVFTPMGGSGEVIRRFNEPSIDRAVIKISLYDICDVPGTHMTRDMVETIKRNCPPHEMKTRVFGEDMQGRGSVFDIDEADIVVPPFANIPHHFFKLWAGDPGIFHPAAFVLLLYDKDNDVIYVADAYRMRDAVPLQHSVRMKKVGAAVPLILPKDAFDRQHGDGRQLRSFYQAAGLSVVNDYAKWPDGTVSTEQGILELRDRMKTGRFKVFGHLSEWFEEFRGYHRDDKGNIVKLYDDIMSATRIGVMGLRHAKQVPLGDKAPPRQSNLELNSDEAIRARCDFDVFA